MQYSTSPEPETGVLADHSLCTYGVSLGGAIGYRRSVFKHAENNISLYHLTIPHDDLN